MKKVWQILSKKSLTTIFAFAPAGLGHLRVTDALYHGLPVDDNVILLGTRDQLDKFFHKLINTYPFMKKLAEWTQYGLPELIITQIYLLFIRSNTYDLSQQLNTILDQRFIVSDRVVIIATHFSLAHQLAVAKKRVERQRQIKIWLIVVVTDDSPQRIWSVQGADLICVPSDHTKNQLQKYFPPKLRNKINFSVLPYPLSPMLSTSLDPATYRKRRIQVRPARSAKIHVSIPVSGAAAGIGPNLAIAEELYSKEKRFQFHIVSRSNSHTLPLLSTLLEKSYMNVYMSPKDRQVVELYEKLFENQVISLEITKPSEQAFKALLPPSQAGGALLLFSESYGRQEKDNLKFLLRNNLIPTKKAQKKLWDLAEKHEEADSDLLEDARSWRGLCLPAHTSKAANFILWCLHTGIFSGMVKYKQVTSNEVASNGVEQFWQTVANLMDSEEVSI